MIRIPRRLRLFRRFLFWVLLVSLLPMALLLTISFHQLLDDAQASLEHRAERTSQELSVVNRQARESLSRIAAAVERGDDDILDLLQVIVYDNSFFREAGVIDSAGYLVLTNLGDVEPPAYIAPDHRPDPALQEMQVYGPFQTKVMRESSIIFGLPTAGDGVVNVLVNPNVLLYFLNIVSEPELGPDGYLAVTNGAGRVMASVGFLPDTGRPAQGPEPDRIFVKTRSPDGLLEVVGSVSTDWVLRYWRRQALIGVPLALVSVLLIFSLLLVLFRKIQAFDYDLQAGLKNEEFELHYQPIVRLDSGKCVGCEALIRWRHPEEGVILPGLFIPSAEKTGLINAIGEWAVQHALDELDHALGPLGLEYVSINVSPIQLNSGSFDKTVRWLAGAAIPKDRLVFEVTEKAVIRESQTNALDTLERARRLGCKVALDDFGTGYSSLSNLTRFEFGVLKIERHFVQGINQSVRTNSVLDSIVQLGRELGVRIIAEGVETEEQRSYLQELGVEYAQGWLYSAALPRDEFERYLSSHQE